MLKIVIMYKCRDMHLCHIHTRTCARTHTHTHTSTHNHKHKHTCTHTKTSIHTPSYSIPSNTLSVHSALDHTSYSRRARRTSAPIAEVRCNCHMQYTATEMWNDLRQDARRVLVNVSDTDQTLIHCNIVTGCENVTNCSMISCLLCYSG